jgi:hypothetical protein
MIEYGSERMEPIDPLCLTPPECFRIVERQPVEAFIFLFGGYMSLGDQGWFGVINLIGHGVLQWYSIAGNLMNLCRLQGLAQIYHEFP